MLKIKQQIVFFGILVVCLFTLSLNVSAIYAFELNGADESYFNTALETVTEEVTDGKGLTHVSGYTGPQGESIADTLFYKLENSNAYVFNTRVFNEVPKKIQKLAITEFKEVIESQPFSVDAQQKIYNALVEVDNVYVATVVDSLFDNSTGTMLHMLQENANTIQTVVGVIGFVLIILFVLSLFVDLVYINLPLIHTMFPPEKRSFASRAARSAVAGKYNNVEEPMDANLAYFKNRVVGVICFGIVFYMLFTGKLGDLVVWVINVFV